MSNSCQRYIKVASRRTPHLGYADGVAGKIEDSVKNNTMHHHVRNQLAQYLYSPMAESRANVRKVWCGRTISFKSMSHEVSSSNECMWINKRRVARVTMAQEKLLRAQITWRLGSSARTMSGEWWARVQSQGWKRHWVRGLMQQPKLWWVYEVDGAMTSSTYDEKQNAIAV